MASDSDPSRIIRFRFGVGEYSALSLPNLPVRPPLRLTKGERHVIALILQGKSNLQIARARGTSVRTVANQVQSIFRKVRVGSRAELVALVGGDPSTR